MYEFMKFGILFVEDFLSMMGMNLFFLLLVLRVILVKIRLDVSCNMYCLLFEG